MRRAIALFLLIVLGIALLFQQGYLDSRTEPVVEKSPAFRDVSIKAGIAGNRNVSLEMSVGQAWGDYDNDGWVDFAKRA